MRYGGMRWRKGRNWIRGCASSKRPALRWMGGRAEPSGLAPKPMIHRADSSVSAGFATVHGNNTLTINAVEAYPLDKFSAEVSFGLYLPLDNRSLLSISKLFLYYR